MKVSLRWELRRSVCFQSFEEVLTPELLEQLRMAVAKKRVSFSCEMKREEGKKFGEISNERVAHV